MTDRFTGISIYPVGVLRALKMTTRSRDPRYLHREANYLRRRIAARNWRAVRNSFNGYLAEWDYPPEGVNHHRCGRGWTKRAALRRLGIHLAFSNVKEGQL